MYSAASANLINIPNRITNPIMIEINPVLQVGAMTVAGMMDRFEKITSEENSELAGINPIVSIAFGRNQFVTTGLSDNEFVHLLMEVTIQPTGHRTFFHRQDLFALE
jgi:hypothetical protein